MALLLYLMFGLAVFFAVISVVFNGNFGRHVISGLEIMVRHTVTDKADRQRGLHSLQGERDELDRLREEISRRMEFDVDEAVAKMVEDMSSVRSFFSASNVDPVVASELSRVENLWQTTLLSWKNEKSKSSERQYAQVVSGIEELDTRVGALSQEAGQPYRDDVHQILQRLRQAQAESESLSDALEKKNFRIRELLSAASARSELEQEKQRFALERQQEQLQSQRERSQSRLAPASTAGDDARERQTERNRQQQEMMRERMQRMREKR